MSLESSLSLSARVPAQMEAVGSLKIPSSESTIYSNQWQQQLDAAVQRHQKKALKKTRMLPRKPRLPPAIHAKRNGFQPVVQ
jgi:hypothetical protein